MAAVHYESLPPGSRTKAEDISAEYSKVFINLASIFLGLTLTFYKDITSSSGMSWAPISIAVSWLLWIISIFCGARALNYLINVSAKVSIKKHNIDNSIDVREYDLFDRQLTNLQRWQQATFLLGFAAAISGPILTAIANPG